jgi:hypothetical protein
VSRAGVADVPAARSDVLFLAAARAAGTVEEVREVWRQAKAASQPQWYLDQVAAIGRGKPGARPGGASAGAA